ATAGYPISRGVCRPVEGRPARRRAPRPVTKRATRFLGASHVRDDDDAVAGARGDGVGLAGSVVVRAAAAAVERVAAAAAGVAAAAAGDGLAGGGHGQPGSAAAAES